VQQILDDERPYTARSVVASTLLGIEPPRLRAQILVRTGELFGIAEGTVRVAISRMLAAGELVADDGHYRLAGHLLTRQARQHLSRTGTTRAWRGKWRIAVVVAEGRSASDRSELRSAMTALRLAERREGVWLRPDNLAPGPADAEAVVARQCRLFQGSPITDATDTSLAQELWDIDGWAATARRLRAALDQLIGDLEGHDISALSPAFVVSAAALRHFQADPLLPPALLPDDWPGAALRHDYERYDRAFKALWRAWFSGQS
jgi:phenylacetic acid degradation operon negative regulatory protein